MEYYMQMQKKNEKDIWTDLEWIARFNAKWKEEKHSTK